MIFIDTSVIVAILSGEDDADRWIERIDGAAARLTSPLVVLEAAMRLSSKLDVSPTAAGEAVAAFLDAAYVDTVEIDRADGLAAIKAFESFGKGRGHPARLNLADCLSYACARNRNASLFYKGDDFRHTDLG